MPIKGDKLCNVRVARIRIVQKLHTREISVADANNDDTERRIANLLENLSRSSWICDAAISQNQKDCVRLFSLSSGGFLRRRGLSSCRLQDFGEDSWATHDQPRLECLTVRIQNTLHTVGFFTRPALEAVTNDPTVLGTESPDRVLLIHIVLCQNTNNCLDGLLVVRKSTARRKVVQSTGLPWIPVGTSKVNGNTDIQFATSSNVIRKGGSTCCSDKGGRRRSICGSSWS
mmetsp:Transcript_15628/g.26123  ORF Transcript_15628/g.26123 Transcript_15628/m.26123 type:complete len:230 (-) Transcript_15628:898-1587(-)